MNEQEAKAIVEKIIQADKVVHSQQLNVDWKPPTDQIFAQFTDGNLAGANSSGMGGADGASFKGAESANHGNSVVHQSLQDSNNQVDGGRSNSEMVDDKSQLTGGKETANADIAVKYERTKNVFKMLIEEADYLIDNRALERCEGQSLKEQFKIKIDSVRKSLGIDNMEDVDLLVETFYNFEAKYKKQQE